MQQSVRFADKDDRVNEPMELRRTLLEFQPKEQTA
ncbi:hypothetical protein EV286_107463 [Rhizobium sp. BK251]|nr:hypothetical protein EV286_107463 [Rhizobium sp. BK251]